MTGAADEEGSVATRRIAGAGAVWCFGSDGLTGCGSGAATPPAGAGSGAGALAPPEGWMVAAAGAAVVMQASSATTVARLIRTSSALDVEAADDRPSLRKYPAEPGRGHAAREIRAGRLVAVDRVVISPMSGIGLEVRDLVSGCVRLRPRTNLTAFVCATLGLVIAASPSEAMPTSRGGGALRLGDRVISVAPAQDGHSGRAALAITFKSLSRRTIALARTDFTLTASGDMFAAKGWDVRGSRTSIGPRHARRFRLSFDAPGTALAHAVLLYRPGGAIGGTLPLDGAARARSRTAHGSTQPGTISTFPITGGAGNPWGTAADSAGKIWFAEPGCDFTPTCPADARPGQIGKFDPSSGRF